MDIPSAQGCITCGRSIALAQLIYPHLKAWRPSPPQITVQERWQFLFAALKVPQPPDVIDGLTRGTLDPQEVFQRLDRDDLYEDLAPLFENPRKTTSILPIVAFKVLGLRRWCCRTHVESPPLVPKGSPFPPKEVPEIRYRRPAEIAHSLSYRQDGTIVVRRAEPEELEDLGGMAMEDLDKEIEAALGDYE